MRVVENVASLDDWEPTPSGEGSDDAARKALEDGLAQGDRVLVMWMTDLGNGEIRQGSITIQRRSRKLHWLTMFGALHEWLQRWAHNDFEH